MKDVWNIVGAVAGVLGVGVALYVFIEERSSQKKKLQVELISRSNLVDENVSKSEGHLQILYDDQKIPNYAILQFRVSNPGGQPIRSADFEEPLQLHLANITKVLSASVLSANPPDLNIQPDYKSTPNYIKVPGLLLNPGDWFMLSVGLVPMSSQTPHIEASARVVGVAHVDFTDAAASGQETAGTLNPFLTRYAIYIQGVVFLLIGAQSAWVIFRRPKAS